MGASAGKSLLLIIIVIICAAGFLSTALPAGAVETGGSPGNGAAEYPGEEMATDSLTLAECVRIARENSPRIKYRKARLAEAGAERDRAAGQRWPEIRSSGSYSRYTETVRMAPPREPGYPLIFADEVLWWNIHASIPLFTAGRISNEVEASGLIRDAARNDLEFARGSIEYGVTEFYYSIFKKRMAIRSLDFSRITLEEHLKKVNALIGAEKASRSDRLRVEVRLADLAQRIEEKKASLAVDKGALLNLMGMEYGEVSIKLPGDLFTDYRVPVLEDALLSAHSRRADYLAAQNELEAQRNRVRAARGAYWPTISLFASYSGQKAVGSYIELPGASELEDIGRVGCMLELPIFMGGRRGSELEIQKSRLAALENSLRELKLRIRLEVESSILRLKSEEKRLAATEKAVAQALESLRIEREKYELGKGSVTDVLDAESALQKIRAARYSALADYQIHVARIRFKTGEYYDPD
ncbi:MAG: hypothetical protein GF417_13100 [Candidatus Latescibacteria bacterium]|nr:hypothetical protein [bacterium]MBD3425364.1 hypothetical protein [Candidatus Latescibacterota bacterium]